MNINFQKSPVNIEESFWEDLYHKKLKVYGLSNNEHEIENGKLSETYIHYLWVRNIDKMDGEKIYIPTEANMPILEAIGNK